MSYFYNYMGVPQGPSDPNAPPQMRAFPVDYLSSPRHNAGSGFGSTSFGRLPPQFPQSANAFLGGMGQQFRPMATLQMPRQVGQFNLPQVQSIGPMGNMGMNMVGQMLMSSVMGDPDAYFGGFGRFNAVQSMIGRNAMMQMEIGQGIRPGAGGRSTFDEGSLEMWRSTIRNISKATYGGADEIRRREIERFKNTTEFKDEARKMQEDNRLSAEERSRRMKQLEARAPDTIQREIDDQVGVFIDRVVRPGLTDSGAAGEIGRAALQALGTSKHGSALQALAPQFFLGQGIFQAMSGMPGVGPLGPEGSDVAGLVSAIMGRAQGPGGAPNLAFTRGFSMTDIGGLAVELSRRDLLGGPEASMEARMARRRRQQLGIPLGDEALGDVFLDQEGVRRRFGLPEDGGTLAINDEGRRILAERIGERKAEARERRYEFVDKAQEVSDIRRPISAEDRMRIRREQLDAMGIDLRDLTPEAKRGLGTVFGNRPVVDANLDEADRQIQNEQITEQLGGYLEMIDELKELFGDDGVPALLEQIEGALGGALGQISPAEIRRVTQDIREVSAITGISGELVAGITGQAAADARSRGLTGIQGAEASLRAMRLAKAATQERIGQGTSVRLGNRTMEEIATIETARQLRGETSDFAIMGGGVIRAIGAAADISDIALDPDATITEQFDTLIAGQRERGLGSSQGDIDRARSIIQAIQTGDNPDLLLDAGQDRAGTRDLFSRVMPGMDPEALENMIFNASRANTEAMRPFAENIRGVQTREIIRENLVEQGGLGGRAKGAMRRVTEGRVGLKGAEANDLAVGFVDALLGSKDLTDEGLRAAGSEFIKSEMKKRGTTISDTEAQALSQSMFEGTRTLMDGPMGQALGGFDTFIETNSAAAKERARKTEAQFDSIFALDKDFRDAGIGREGFVGRLLRDLATDDTDTTKESLGKLLGNVDIDDKMRPVLKERIEKTAKALDLATQEGLEPKEKEARVKDFRDQLSELKKMGKVLDIVEKEGKRGEEEAKQKAAQGVKEAAGGMTAEESRAVVEGSEAEQQIVRELQKMQGVATGATSSAKLKQGRAGAGFGVGIMGDMTDEERQALAEEIGAEKANLRSLGITDDMTDEERQDLAVKLGESKARLRELGIDAAVGLSPDQGVELAKGLEETAKREGRSGKLTLVAKDVRGTLKHHSTGQDIAELELTRIEMQEETANGAERGDGTP